MDETPTLERRPLTRLAREDWQGSRYFHPNGYVIERERRTWSERGREPGRTGHDPAPPLHWWHVYNHVARRQSMLTSHGRGPGFLGVISCRASDNRDFDTLGEARAWCDTHERDGWLGL